MYSFASADDVKIFMTGTVRVHKPGNNEQVLTRKLTSNEAVYSKIDTLRLFISVSLLLRASSLSALLILSVWASPSRRWMISLY